MGTEEDRGDHGEATSRHDGSFRRDRGARSARRWLAAARTPTTVRWVLGGTAAPDPDRAERPVDRGLQGVVADQRRDAMRSAHGAGWIQSLRTGPSAVDADADRGRSPDFRAAVRQVRVAEGDPE